MKAQLLGLLAEAPIHAGSGQSTGFVDLPVTREAATDHPVIAGSSFKGALRDLARSQRQGEDQGDGEGELERVFGKPDRAGALIVSDARLLLLPVRSMTSAYRWVTCPYLVERLLRDRARAGAPAVDIDHEALRAVTRGCALAAGEEVLFLEERQLARTGPVPRGLCALIEGLVVHGPTGRRLPDQIVVLHDHDFAWFARYGLAITARNQLNEDTKTSENLWYEEALPPDTLLYVLLAERDAGALDRIRALFDGRPYLQVGGNETVGQGWLAVALPEAGDAAPGGRA